MSTNTDRVITTVTTSNCWSYDRVVRLLGSKWFFLLTLCVANKIGASPAGSWSSEKAGGPGEAAQSGRLSAGPPFAAREVMRPIISLVRCRRGVVALEFVLVAPVLLLLLFGILYFGIALNNHLVLTAAAEQGAQTLSFGRGTSSPYSTAETAINSAAANLNTSEITPSVKIGSSSCSGDSACSTLLTAGAVATVALTYPCDLTFLGYSFGGSPCTLSAQSAAIVQ
jgi:hypothetical protein